MSSLSHQANANLAAVSISVSPAKNDPEIEGALLADDFYRTIWPRIIDQNDKTMALGDTEPMNDITREDLSKSLSGIEDRMDKRIERMEQDTARRSDDLRREMRLRERSARRESIATKEALRAHIESNDKAVASTLAALERTEKEFGTVKQANKEQRYWMAGIGVAIVLGIMGANATIFGGGKTFFDGGANSVINQQKVEQLIQEAKTQSDANSALLIQIQARQESRTSPTSAKP